MESIQLLVVSRDARMFSRDSPWPLWDLCTAFVPNRQQTPSTDFWQIPQASAPGGTFSFRSYSQILLTPAGAGCSSIASSWPILPHPCSDKCFFYQLLPGLLHLGTPVSLLSSYSPGEYNYQAPCSHVSNS